MMQLHIPKPCHEDWNKMMPNEQGRHCNVCCKTVVDFTGMTDNEIKYFFLNKKKDENVCGRFRNEQLQQIRIELPHNIIKQSMPLWKRFLTACLLAFSSMLFSCNTNIGNDVTGEISLPKREISSNEKTNSPSLQTDTSVKPGCYTLMGDTAVIETSVTQGVTVAIPVEDKVEEVLVQPVPIELPDTFNMTRSGKVVIEKENNPSRKETDSIDDDTKKDCNTDFISL